MRPRPVQPLGAAKLGRLTPQRRRFGCGQCTGGGQRLTNVVTGGHAPEYQLAEWTPLGTWGPRHAILRPVRRDWAPAASRCAKRGVRFFRTRAEVGDRRPKMRNARALGLTLALGDAVATGCGCSSSFQYLRGDHLHAGPDLSRDVLARTEPLPRQPQGRAASRCAPGARTRAPSAPIHNLLTPSMAGRGALCGSHRRKCRARSVPEANWTSRRSWTGSAFSVTRRPRCGRPWRAPASR